MLGRQDLGQLRDWLPSRQGMVVSPSQRAAQSLPVGVGGWPQLSVCEEA